MDTLKFILEKYNLTEGRYLALPISREEFATLLAELNFNTGAEIGVERGLYSEELCKANPNLKLSCIDAWKAYKGYRDHVDQAKLNRFHKETKERLAPYKCDVIKDWSMGAVKKFKDESLDFVYIDGNHDFKNVTDDIAEWSKKVRKGGIVAGHDYVRLRTSIECQVKAVIDAWAYTYKISPVFIVTGNPFSSWFWVKK